MLINAASTFSFHANISLASSPPSFASSLCEVMTRSKPRFARSSAISLPMPLSAPVMKAQPSPGQRSDAMLGAAAVAGPAALCHALSRRQIARRSPVLTECNLGSRNKNAVSRVSVRQCAHLIALHEFELSAAA